MEIITTVPIDAAVPKKFTEAYCMEPPYITELIKPAHINPYPLLCRRTPNPIPKGIYPVRTGILSINALLKDLFLINVLSNYVISFI